MKRVTAAIFLALAMLVATPASAYVLVLKGGTRVDVGEAYRISGSRLAYVSAAGEMRLISLAEIDLDATARENGETISEFLDRAARPRRVTASAPIATAAPAPAPRSAAPAPAPRSAAPAPKSSAPAPAPQPVVDDTPITVTNADLEPYRIERERLDREYYAHHPKPPAYYPPDTPAATAPGLLDDDYEQWRQQAAALRDQLDVEQAQIDVLRDEVALRQNNPLKYRMSYEYNFGNAPVILQRGRYRSLSNPLYGNLRADDEFTQINSRLIDLEIQHRATLKLWDNFEERARRAGVPPGVLRE